MPKKKKKKNFKKLLPNVVDPMPRWHNQGYNYYDELFVDKYKKSPGDIACLGCKGGWTGSIANPLRSTSHVLRDGLVMNQDGELELEEAHKICRQRLKENNKIKQALDIVMCEVCAKHEKHEKRSSSIVQRIYQYQQQLRQELRDVQERLNEDSSSNWSADSGYTASSTVSSSVSSTCSTVYPEEPENLKERPPDCLVCLVTDKAKTKFPKIVKKHAVPIRHNNLRDFIIHYVLENRDDLEANEGLKILFMPPSMTEQQRRINVKNSQDQDVLIVFEPKEWDHPQDENGAIAITQAYDVVGVEQVQQQESNVVVNVPVAAVAAATSDSDAVNVSASIQKQVNKTHNNFLYTLLTILHLVGKNGGGNGASRDYCGTDGANGCHVQRRGRVQRHGRGRRHAERDQEEDVIGGRAGADEAHAGNSKRGGDQGSNGGQNSRQGQSAVACLQPQIALQGQRYGALNGLHEEQDVVVVDDVTGL